MSRSRLAFAFGLLTCVCSVSPRAFADDKALAREHYRKGSTAYYLQRYSEAAAEYEKAFEKKDDPSLLFNIGQAYRLAGENQKAIGAYRAFLARLPETPHRVEVLALIEDVKKTIEAHAKTQEKPPRGTLPEQPEPALAKKSVVEVKAPEPEVVPPPTVTVREADPHQLALGRRMRFAGIGAGALGVAALAVGGAFAGLTTNVNDQLNHPTAPEGGGLPVYDRSLEAQGRTYQALETAFLVVGGAALVAGVTVFVLGTQKVKRNQFALAPVVGPGQAGASLRVAF